MILNDMGFISAPVYLFSRSLESISIKHPPDKGMEPEHLCNGKLHTGSRWSNGMAGSAGHLGRSSSGVFAVASVLETSDPRTYSEKPCSVTNKLRKALRDSRDVNRGK